MCSKKEDEGGADGSSGQDRDTKGKGKETSLSDRLQASGRMTANAAFGTQPFPTTSRSNEKVDSRNQSQRSVPEFVLGEGSRLRPENKVGQSVRGRGNHLTQVSSSGFEEFMNEAPQLTGTPGAHPTAKGIAVQRQEEVDGSEAIALLSEPDEPPTMQDFENTLSEHEAARLRAALFSSDSHPPAWNELLSFTPDFITKPGGSVEVALHLGLSDPEAARQVWLQQWGGVLEAYTDEVWGDLDALVAKAKSEVDELTANPDASSAGNAELKALGRLRQILAHVRGRP
jgi:hypothetical protein